MFGTTALPHHHSRKFNSIVWLAGRCRPRPAINVNETREIEKLQKRKTTASGRMFQQARHPVPEERRGARPGWAAASSASKEFGVKAAHGVLGLAVAHNQADVSLAGALRHHLHVDALTPQHLEHLRGGAGLQLLSGRCQLPAGRRPCLLHALRRASWHRAAEMAQKRGRICTTGSMGSAASPVRGWWTFFGRCR